MCKKNVIYKICLQTIYIYIYIYIWYKEDLALNNQQWLIYHKTQPNQYLFIICLDYELRTSIDKIKENGFKLTTDRSRRYPAQTITDADYADDIVLLANAPAQAETLQLSLELYHTHDTDKRDVHRMFITHIYIEHRNLETQKTLDDFLVQVRNFLLSLSLNLLRHKERDTHSFYSGFSICTPPSRAAPVARKFVWPLRAPKVDPSHSVSSSQLNWLFSKSLKSSARFRCVTSSELSSPVSHLGYCDISEWHVRSANAREHLR